MERIEKVLEEFGVQYEWYKRKDGVYYGFVEFWTSIANQYIVVEIYYDGTEIDFVNKFIEHAIKYDVDDEVAFFARTRGKNGIPESIRKILDDCQEAKDTLMAIADKLNKAMEKRVGLKTFAITYEEIHRETVLIEAESLDKAIEKVEEYNANVGFDADEISEVTIEKSKYANEDGTATKEQLRNCWTLEGE